MAHVRFKAKIKQIIEPDGTKSDYIDYKRHVTRKDSDIKPHQHYFYNSDMFESMLQRAYWKVTHQKAYVRLRDLPPGVKVDTSGFLATVTVTLPDDFK